MKCKRTKQTFLTLSLLCLFIGQLYFTHAQAQSAIVTGSNFTLYFSQGSSLAFQHMPIIYLTNGGTVTLTVETGTLNGTACTLAMYDSSGSLYFSSLNTTTINLHSPQIVNWFVNGELYSNDTAVSIANGVGYAIDWRINEPAFLLPITFIIGMVGLASSFAGPMYAIYKVKKGEYYEGMRQGVIITALGFALTIAWLWSV